MTAARNVTPDEVAAVLREVFPAAEGIDVEGILAGRDVSYRPVPGGAKLDFGQVAQLVKEWAPTVAAIVGIVKNLYDLYRAGTATAEPSAADVRRAFTEEGGTLPADEATFDDAADIAIERERGR